MVTLFTIVVNIGCKLNLVVIIAIILGRSLMTKLTLTFELTALRKHNET